MSTLRRWFVGSLLAGILGFQVLIAVPPVVHGAWFWPFLDYPMYSSSHHAGERIRFHRLEGMACGSGEAVELDHRSLGVQWFLLDDLLSRTAEGRENATERLRGLVRENRGSAICSVRVYRRSLRVGEVRGDEMPPWRPAVELDVR